MLVKAYCVVALTLFSSSALGDEPSAATPAVISAAAAPRHQLGKKGSLAQLYLNQSVGVSDLALTVLFLKPGEVVPPHRHEKSAEALYIQSGRVAMIIAGERKTAQAGDAVYIPAGVEHSAIVLPGGAVKAIQIYVGPGPEKRFMKGNLLPRKDS